MNIININISDRPFSHLLLLIIHACMCAYTAKNHAANLLHYVLHLCKNK